MLLMPGVLMSGNIVEQYNSSRGNLTIPIKIIMPTNAFSSSMVVSFQTRPIRLFVIQVPALCQPPLIVR